MAVGLPPRYPPPPITIAKSTRTEQNITNERRQTHTKVKYPLISGSLLLFTPNLTTVTLSLHSSAQSTEHNAKL